MIKKFVSLEFVFFLLTGGTAAFVNFLSRIVYGNWFGYSLSILIAYITGMIVAFVLAKFFVFKQSHQSINKSIIFFILVNILAVIQTWLISVGLVYYVLPKLNVSYHPKEIAHAIGVMAPVFTSYIGHKHYSFK